MCGITAYLGNESGFDLVYQGIEQLQNRGYDSCGIASIKPIVQLQPPILQSSVSPVSQVIQPSDLQGPSNFIAVRKYASQPDLPAVQRLAQHKLELESHCLIAHTRWSTHGRISDQNSHPHQDQTKHLALVHNGIIENYLALKKFLLAQGLTFQSETDTEIIVQLIGYYREKMVLNSASDSDLKAATLEAIKLATQKLEGTWGVVLIDDRTPKSIYLSKNGSPLLVGYDEQMILVASETAGLAHAVHKYFNLKDHQILRVDLFEGPVSQNFDGPVSQKIDGPVSQIFDGPVSSESKIIFSETPLETQTQQISADQSGLITSSPAPYPHWMLKEIMEQSETAARALNQGGRLQNKCLARLGGLEAHQEDLLKIKDLIILGCGTSYHAGLLGAFYFKRFGCFRSVQVIDASEFSLEDLPKNQNRRSGSGGGDKNSIDNNTGILVLSQSGETKDVHRAMELTQDQVPIFSIVNVVESLIARQALCGVYLNAGREVAVASTKSFTSQVIALILVTIWFAGHRKIAKLARTRMVEALRSLPTQVENLLTRNLNHLFPEALIQKLIQAPRIFVLGRGPGYALAKEIALKIKEVSYIHAESYPAGGLKHGPFALIEPGIPIILISLNEFEESAGKMDLAAIETQTRAAWTIGLTTRSEIVNRAAYDDLIKVPSENAATDPIMLIIAGQYLAYRLALARGINPDYPRNLAKVVTVDG